jgi:pyruvate,water dikinase
VLVRLAEADGRCGAKAAILARLLQAGVAVPDGVVVADPDGDGWLAMLEPALRVLGAKRFAVRSSAGREDGDRVSFAGQLRTTLNVLIAQAADEVRRTGSSASSDQVDAYALRTGREVDAVVPVIVQVMVDAQVAGVAFTRHPVSGADEVVIEAVRGLGDRLAAGTVTPERWIIDRPGTTEARGRTILTAAQARAVSETARRIEHLFGCPQDVEWAFADGQLWVLQARPITAGGVDAGQVGPAAGRVLVSGTPSSPGSATGRVRVIAGLDAFGHFAAGEVLVCRATSPAWTPLLARAAAVVTETGGVLAHTAIVAREFAIPAVTAAAGAMTRLVDGQRVVVNGTSGTVTAPSAEESA